MGTTSLVLVAPIPFGLLIILGLPVDQVVVIQEVELQSITAGQGMLTDSNLVGHTFQPNIKGNSSNRETLAHLMRGEDGRLGRRKVGQLEITMLEGRDKGKTYLAPAAQVVEEVRWPA